MKRKVTDMNPIDVPRVDNIKKMKGNETKKIGKQKRSILEKILFLFIIKRWGSDTFLHRMKFFLHKFLV